MGTAHYSQGVSSAVHQHEIYETIRLRPATCLPTILGMDTNAAVGWTRTEEQGTTVVGTDAKSNLMIGTLEFEGYQVIPPSQAQFHTPTSRPRKQEAQGHCIDMLAAKHVMKARLEILVDSHKLMDTDHDMAVAHVTLRAQRGGAYCRVDTRARVVTAVIPPQPMMDQEVLKHLAVEYTKPQKGQGYQDPEHVKVYYRVAKQSGHKDDWKRAHKERQRAREEWKKGKLQKALEGDWQALRQTRDTLTSGWEVGFADQQVKDGKDPHMVVHDHFEAIFNKGDEVGDHFEGTFTRSEDFAVEELEGAVSKAKPGKSVGKDGTSAELFKALVSDPISKLAILEWYNRILHEGVLPRDWGHALLVVLPKTRSPTQPKELRPIALGSAASKIFCRMLLARAEQVVRPTRPNQCAGKGRQTCDYLFAIARTFELEREWKGGTAWYRLDITKAFDSLRRRTFLEKLQLTLGRTEEFRCWIRTLQGNTASIQTLWGCTNVDLTRGIKQGAVESPSFFGKVIEWAYMEASELGKWEGDTKSMPGMMVDGVAFMDDGVLWEGGVDRLKSKIEVLTMALRRWGLTLNHAKSRLYVSPHASSKTMFIEGVEVKAGDHLEVMNVPFKVGATATELLQPVFAMARKKFWANKHVLTNR